jgi:hypothetical protein
MKIPYSILASQDSRHVRNYLYTFGYLVLSDFFSRDEIDSQNKIWDDRFHDLTALNVDNTPTYLSVANYIEKSGAPLLTSDGGERFVSLVKKIIGPTAIYCGSTASEMSVPTPWHRDIFLKTPIFKFGTYINNVDGGGVSNAGGDLSVVPGSHHAGDVYADGLSSAVHWPERFGICRTPIQFPMMQASDGSTTLDDYPKVDPITSPFPYQQLKVSPYDLVIFDQRIVHGSTFYQHGKARRMVVAVFATDPHQIQRNSKLGYGGYRAVDGELELSRYLTNQINSSELKTLYDDLLIRPDMMKVLDKNISLYKDLARTITNRIKMRDSLDTERAFNRRNMTDRDIPVCY